MADPLLLDELHGLLAEDDTDRKFVKLIRQAWKDQEREELAGQIRALGDESWLKSKLQKFKRLASDARLAAEAPQAYGKPYVKLAQLEKEQAWYEFVVDVLKFALEADEEGVVGTGKVMAELRELLGFPK